MERPSLSADPLALSRTQWNRIRKRKNGQLDALRSSLTDARRTIDALRRRLGEHETSTQTGPTEGPTVIENANDNPEDNTMDTPNELNDTQPPAQPSEGEPAEDAAQTDLEALQAQLQAAQARAEAAEEQAAEAEAKVAELQAALEAKAAQEAYQDLLKKLDAAYGAEHRAAAIDAANAVLAEMGYGEGNPAPTQVMADRLEIAYLQEALAGQPEPAPADPTPPAETLDTGVGGNAGLVATEGTLQEVLADMQRAGKLR